MKLMAAVTLGCGFIAAPMVSAPLASAYPASCNGTDVACVPYIERGAVPETPVKKTSRIAVDDNPRLALSIGGFVLPGILVIGVHLNAQDIGGVEELEKERKLPGARGGMLSEDIWTVLACQLV